MTTSRWVNTEPDAGALHALLARLAERVPPASIDELWIFPTRRIAIGESTVFVVAGFDSGEPDRRRVITARYAVTRDRKGIATVQEKLDEHGTAPETAVARIVQGVLRRLGEEGEQPPREHAVEGEEDRWWALVEELGGRRPAVSADEGAADPGEEGTGAPGGDVAPAAHAAAADPGEEGTGAPPSDVAPAPVEDSVRPDPGREESGAR